MISTLSEILITDLPEQRASRNPDYKVENEALISLLQAAHDREELMHDVTRVAANICKADSAGVSTVEQSADGPVLRWEAFYGEGSWCSTSIHRVQDSPCSRVLDDGLGRLFLLPGHDYPAMSQIHPSVVEQLVVPFNVDGKRSGTLWTATHTEGREFDAEDARLLESLAYAAGNLVSLPAMRYEQREHEVKVLQEESRRLARIMEIDAVGVITVTKDGRITSANNAFLRMSGYSSSDLDEGILRWDQMTPPESAEATQLVMEDLFSHGLSATYEKECLRKDGTRWCGMFAGTRVSEHEAIEIVWDITETRQVELELARSEESFRALLQTTSDAFYRMSPDWSEMYELQGGDFLKDTAAPQRNWLKEYIHPDDQPEVLAAIEEAIQNKTPFELEHRVRRVDGSLGWVLSRAVPLLDEHGEIRFWFGAGSDFTIRRQTEEALRQSEQQLSRRVEEATANLRSLSRELMKAQESERRRLAHELHDEIGQALTGLSFTLEMAGRERKDALISQAETITHDLFDKVRTMTLELRPSALDDLGLIPALLSLVERFSTQTGLEIDLYHEGDNRRFTPDIEVAAYRITQEALTNIARHSQSQRAVIQVVHNNFLAVSIADEGQGFDVERVSAKADRSGLTGMRERAHLVGGDLTIDSNPGEGTRITLEIDGGHLDDTEEEPD